MQGKDKPNLCENPLCEISLDEHGAEENGKTLCLVCGVVQNLEEGE